MNKANYAPIYCSIYPELAEIARNHGYALAVHGSMARDFDLICIPWVDRPSSPEDVVASIIKTYSYRTVEPTKKETKPHGRLVFTLVQDDGFGMFLDIGFMPTTKEKGDD